MPAPIHFEIQASHPDAVIAFYSGLFGWTFKRWGEADYWLIETQAGATPGSAIGGGLLPRRGAPPLDGAAVNAFVCTMRVEQLDAAVARAAQLGGSVVVPKMPIAGVGWLAYAKDTEGNIFGMMQPDPAAG